MTRRGLTIVEVMVALLVVGIAFTVISIALVNSIRQTDRAGARTQSTQYLSYLGRMVAGGAAGVLAFPAEPEQWDYGQLADAFEDLPTGAGGREDAARYRAIVENVGAVSVAGAAAVQYRITVCTTSVAGEACISGVTVGPEPSVDGNPAPLEGIN